MKKYIVEGFGTFIWIFLGLLIIYVTETETVLFIGLMFGILYYVIYSLFKNISISHFNPCITFAFLLSKKCSLKEFWGNVIAQFIGSCIASLMVFFIWSNSSASTSKVSAFLLSFDKFSGNGFGFVSCVAFEIIFVFFLVYAFLYIKSNDSLKQAFPIIISILYALFIFISFPISNSTVNPARFFGPAIVFGISTGRMYSIAQFFILLVFDILAVWLAYFVFTCKCKNPKSFILRFFNSVITGYKRYIDFKGRETRFKFWSFTVFFVFIELCFSFFIFRYLDNGSVFDLIFMIIMGVGVLLSVIPSIAITIRRLHDIEKSGWCLFLFFIPIAGLILYFIWMTKSSVNNNSNNNK